ncbi:hypothetical protein GALMADRAFT_230064 [Galerina marginata CBS 339.88]|uniref:Integrase core domain-containing protein n=1 Tax=Galerina marginata (strain CBS 339.88) TaxID=685588 RepID=A0A067SK89_GALM3|nr:hypothetical protein GALMADRAFT_230064 [Galerina marginata CBS 339.88]
MASSSAHNRNPKGKNQFAPVLTADDPTLQAALEKYHRGLITDNARISELLLADHGIEMKPRTVKKRRKELGLVGSRTTMKMLDPKEAEQLVLDQMDRDLARHQGPRVIRHKLAVRTGHHLTRDFVMETMQLHDSDGFEKREPMAKKIHREPKVPIGTNERWSADGHDKLYGIGFPVWAIVEDATGQWLDCWVVPSNRMGHVVLYLFLCAIEDVGGMPLQITTDCGSETTQLHAMAKALRESFHPDIDPKETPAHVYVRSVHNIAVERSWLRLRLEFGDSTVICFKQGEDDGIYLVHIPEHEQLCQWLWPKLLRKLAKEFMDSRNSYKSRLDHNKPGPSGISRNEAFSLPHKWGGRQCLLDVNMDVIRELKDIISGGEDMFRFPLVTAQFEREADKIYESLHIEDLSLCNVWSIFSAMLPLLLVAEKTF